MKKIHKFILKAYLGPMVLTFFIVMFVLMMNFVWRYIDELVGKGLDFGIIVELLGYSMANMIPLGLPLATLLAAIMTMGNLGENYELLAMKSAGMSLPAILRPLVVVVFFVSVGSFFVANNLVPYANKRMFAIIYDIRQQKQTLEFKDGLFFNGIDNMSIRVGHQDPKTSLLNDVLIYDTRDANGNMTTTIADSGYIHLSDDKKFLLVTLYKGDTYETTRNYKWNEANDLRHHTFDRQDGKIPMSGFDFERTNSELFNSSQTKNIAQLDVDIDSLDRMAKVNTARSYEPFLKSYLLQNDKDVMGIMDTVQNNYSYKRKVNVLDSIPNKGLYDKKALWSSARSSARMSRNSLAFNEDSAKENLNQLYRSKVEWHRKMSLPVSVMIFFLIGAPLGAIIRKGGLAVPIVVSVLFFVFYYIISIAGEKMTKEGTWDAVAGMWLSSFVLFPIAVYLTYKATNDSNLLNVEWYIMKYQKLAAWFKQKFSKNSETVDKSISSKDSKKHKKSVVNIDPKSLRIVFMGTPDFAVASLRALVEGGYNVVAVVTMPDKPAGRGQHLRQSAVKEYAVSAGLTVLQPEKLKDEAFVEQFKALNADLGIVIAFRMLPEIIWSAPRLGTFNLHASLLPQYRGAAPINWAIINGEKETGITTFMLNHKIDEGAVVGRRRVAIEPDDNFGTMHDKLMNEGVELVVETVEKIAQGKYKAEKQNDNGALKSAPKIFKADCHIDFNHNGQSIENLVRGLSPYPAAWFALSDSLTVKVFEAHFVADDNKRECGFIDTDNRTYLHICCADGYIDIVDLQLSGKKRMSTAELLRGFREFGDYSAQ